MSDTPYSRKPFVPPWTALIIDVDNTLLTSPRPGSFEAWEKQVQEQVFTPVERAIEGVKHELSQLGPQQQVFILTARAEKLRESTRENLGRFFPELMEKCRLMMGREGEAGGFPFKMYQLASLMSVTGGAVKVIDDDEEVKQWLRPIDSFCHAPSYWLEKEIG